MTTYTSAASGNWSNGATWVGGVKPPAGAGHAIVIASGHVVTYDEAGPNTYGDDTANGIVINGTLKFSRSVSTELVCRGTIRIDTGGTLDMGTEADPIPASVKTTLRLNDSASMANLRWELNTTTSADWAGFRIWGADKTNKTKMSAALATDTVISVNDATGWEIGDWLYFGPALASNSASSHTGRVITGISGNNITLGASLGVASHAGRTVVNLTRNVKIKAVQGNSYRALMRIRPRNNSTTANAIEIGPCEIALLGSATSVDGAGGFNLVCGQFPNTTAEAIKKIYRPVFHTIWDISGSTVTYFPTSGGLNCPASISNTKAMKTLITEAVFVHQNAGFSVILSDASADFVGCTFLGCSSLFSGAASATVLVTLQSCLATGISGDLLSGTFTKFDATETEFDGIKNIGGSAVMSGTLTSCNLGSTLGIYTPAANLTFAAGVLSDVLLENCIVAYEPTITRNTATSQSNQYTDMYFKNWNNSYLNQKHFKRGGIVLRNNSVKKAGNSSVEIQPWFAGIPVTFSFDVDCAANEAVRLIGYLRKNAAYTGSTPPKITISGMGITPITFTGGATADVWDKFDLTATNPNAYSGKFTVTFQGESTANSTSPACYLDGVYIINMVGVCRHYGFIFEPSSKVTANPFITQTNEATVAAYSGISINHTTQTVTISADTSIQKLYDYSQYDLCQNLTREEWLSTTDGNLYTCQYDIVLDGGNLTGSGQVDMPDNLVTITASEEVRIPLTDSEGTFTNISLIGLTVGARVQVYDVTDAQELANFVAAASTFTIYQKHISDKTIRMRTNYVSGTSAFYGEQATAVLTAGGASFLSSPSADTVYEANAIDGSTVTEFITDYPNVQIDISDPDSVTTVQRLYAWYRYNTMSAEGIRNFFGGIFAEDVFNYRIVTATANIKLDNTQTTPVTIAGARLFADDGSTVIAATSGSIHMDPDKAYVAASNSEFSATDSKRIKMLYLGSL